MTSHSLRYLANCSMLFTEVPLLERPAAAKAAGFDAVEFWWPWPDQPVPADADVDAFVTAVAGRRRAARRGSTSSPATSPVPTAACSPSRPRRSSSGTTSRSRSASVSGWAPRPSTPSTATASTTPRPRQQDELGAENLALRGRRPPPRIGATVLVEPVSGPKPYPLRTADDAVGVMDRVQATGTANVGFLCDLFHLANNGDDVDAAIADHADRIAHVQIADAPGRGEPGTGALAARPLARRARRGRLRRLRRPRVQADDHDRGQPRMAPGRASLNLDTPDTQGDPHNDQRSPSSASASWAARWPATWPRPATRSTGFNRTPDKPRRSSPPAARRAGIDRRGRHATPTWSSSWCPDSPDVQEVLAGRGRRLRQRQARHARHRLLQHPPRRHRRAGRGGRGSRHPADRRPGLRRRGGRQGRGAVDHGRRRRGRLRGGQAAARRGRQDRRARRPGSGSGQTVKAANQLIVAGNIEALAEAVVFLEAYGVDTEAALEVLGGGLAGSTVLNQKKQNMLDRLVRARLPDRPAPQGHGHRHLAPPARPASSSRSAPSSPS